MNTKYELNNLQKDDEMYKEAYGSHACVSEVFSAMVKGEELRRFGDRADSSVNYIKALGERAASGDGVAVAELNTLRRFAIETPIMEEIKLLDIFGKHTALAAGETPLREVYTFVGDPAREQANAGDVPFGEYVRDEYHVPTFTISGGYAVDYRKVALGDMAIENEGLNRVKKTIINKAALAVVNHMYNAVKNSTGIKYMIEDAGLTKKNVDAALTKIRRWGKPTVVADYALISQFTPWAGYYGQVNSTTLSGMSEKAMNEIAQRGSLSMYNGAILAELPNPYDIFHTTGEGADKNFATLLPAGLGFIIPTGVDSPIETYSRGGLTSFTGNNVKNGKVETRFDLELGVDVAKGQEYKIGTIYDTNVGGLSE